jgi:hypothetical protein
MRASSNCTVFQLPELAVQWLTGHGWIQHPSSWYCGNHANRLSGQ